jgi:uncharacterized protein YggE
MNYNREVPMQNKVSCVVIIVLAFVCLVLSLSIGRASDVAAQPKVSSLEPVSEQDGLPSSGVTVSSEETKNFLADEYVTSFKIVLKDKNKDVAYKRLNESREKILALLQKHSVGPQEYELLSTSLEKEWNYAKGKRYFLGYTASQTVKVVLHSKQESDSLEFDLTSFAFVDDVSTLSRLKNAEALEVGVIKSACKKASRLAEENAHSVGAKVGKVISVEGSSEVEKLSTSDSVEVSASVSATLSLDGVENSGKSYVRVVQIENKKFLADKFVVTVNITFDGADKEALFKDMTARRGDVVQMAKDLGVAESEIEAQSMTLRKKRKYEFYGNESQKNAFRANQRITVNFTSKDAAGAFLDGIVGLENVNVYKAEPVLKNEDSLRVQVTNIAGKKAMARAKAIAEGFDGSLGKVVAVSNKPVDEFGTTVLGARSGAMYSMFKRRSSPAYDLLSNSPPESGMNIADSVSVSAYLAIMAEIE